MSHQGPLEVPAGCLLSGLDLTASQHLGQQMLTSDIIIQGHRIELGDMKLMVYTVMGAKDAMQVRFFYCSFNYMPFHSHGITSHEEILTTVILFVVTVNEQTWRSG